MTAAPLPMIRSWSMKITGSRSMHGPYHAQVATIGQIVIFMMSS